MSAPEASAQQDGWLPEHTDHVPEAVAAAARAAFVRRTAPGRLARLAFDSDQDVLGTVEPRRLRFDHGAAHLEVRVAINGRRRELSASSSPEMVLTVERYCDPPATPVPLVDDRPFAGWQGDLVRLAVNPGSGGSEPIHTEWFRL
ncbi:MAG TPA: hypothetical protein VFA83_08685 [Acidimicrobiales bacterium]|nr:hypothetical protein [Acidimicrobiales bacterium]